MAQHVLQDFIGEYKGKIDAAIAAEFSNREKEVAAISTELVSIVQAMRELSVGGKRLRGLLTILGYEIAGGEKSSEIVKAAVVMELFHLGLLIQDDVMDRDTLRRGVATIHTRYTDLHIGESVAMCAGDFTYGWGMETLAKLSAKGRSAYGGNFSNFQITQAMAVWAKYFYRVGYGQVLDVVKVADDKTLLTILALKSGEYSCALPLQFGAALAGADENTLQFLYDFGMELGWVFQLRDDWLGEYGDSTKTGKPVGNDSREGKHTYATMYGREETEMAIAEHLAKGKELLRGRTSKYGEIMGELLTWMATRED